MTDRSTTRRPIARLTPSGVQEASDALVVEAPLQISLASTPIAVLMRTPGADEDLVRGFALTEAIVLQPGEIAGVTRIGIVGDDDARYRIELAPGVTVDPERFRRNLYATSSCGVCGKASIDAVRITAAAPGPGPRVDAATLLRLPDVMRSSQAAFAATGGLHAAAAFDAAGTLLAIAEDIGRHNAVDKLVGAMSRARWPLAEVVLLVSGRVSFEIVQKAAVAGIPFVVGISAASSLAVDLAAELGMTVVGFLREDGANVYTDGGRIAG